MTTDTPLFEEITWEGKIIAMIMRRDFKTPDLTFFSPAEFSQQLGFLPHKRGNIIPAHFHRRVQREITLTQEVLLIRKGRVSVDLYTEDTHYITTRELVEGDILFLCSGGHGFKILEDAEIVEVKQGPYSGKESDKIVFERHDR